MFHIKSTPALTNNHEIWIEIPEFLAHFDKEGIWISLHIIWIPVTMIFISNDNLAIHEVFRGVGWFSIYINPLELLKIWLHDLWPSLSIIEMNSINIKILSVWYDLIN